MLVERQAFLDALHALSGGVATLTESEADEHVERIGHMFALYERELLAQCEFYVTKLGELTVTQNVETARDTAAQAIKEAEYRWG